MMGLGNANQHGLPFISGCLGFLSKTFMESVYGKDMYSGAPKKGLIPGVHVFGGLPQRQAGANRCGPGDGRDDGDKQHAGECREEEKIAIADTVYVSETAAAILR